MISFYRAALISYSGAAFLMAGPTSSNYSDKFDITGAITFEAGTNVPGIEVKEAPTFHRVVWAFLVMSGDSASSTSTSQSRFEASPRV